MSPVNIDKPDFVAPDGVLTIFLQQMHQMTALRRSSAHQLQLHM